MKCYPAKVSYQMPPSGRPRGLRNDLLADDAAKWRNFPLWAYQDIVLLPHNPMVIDWRVLLEVNELIAAKDRRFMPLVPIPEPLPRGNPRKVGIDECCDLLFLEKSFRLTYTKSEMYIWSIEI